MVISYPDDLLQLPFVQLIATNAKCECIISMGLILLHRDGLDDMLQTPYPMLNQPIYLIT